MQLHLLDHLDLVEAVVLGDTLVGVFGFFQLLLERGQLGLLRSKVCIRRSELYRDRMGMRENTVVNRAIQYKTEHTFPLATPFI
jgi:hypothetical protein